MLTPRLVAAALVVCGLLADAPTSAHAQDADVRWDPGWSRFGWADLGLTTVLATEWFVVGMIDDPPHPARVNVFPDQPIRQALRARQRSGRELADDLSDVLIYSLLAQTYLVDAVTVAWLVHDVEDTAWQLAAIDTQSLVIAGALAYTLKTLLPRERPFRRGCRARLGYAAGCHDATDLGRSFPSGHTVLASTIAGLTCAHHEHLALYGGGAGDVAACGAAIGLATLVGALRIVADKHYVTDVLVGGVIGFIAGWLLPTAFYYGFGDSRRTLGGTTGVVVEAVSAPPTIFSYGAAF